MPTALSKLQQRSDRRHRRGASGHAISKVHARAHSWSRAKSNASDLAAKMAAAGMDHAEAQRIAAIIGAAPASSSMSSALGMRLGNAQIAGPELKDAILMALRFTPIGTALNAIFALCDQFDLALGIGIGGAVGVLEGVGGGGGIVFGPNRTIAIYGSAGIVMGFIFDGSVGVQLTVVHGGISAFSGTSYTLGGAIGEGGGLAGHFIMNTRGQVIGLQVEIELRGGVPVDAIAGIWETHIIASGQFSYRPQPRSMFKWSGGGDEENQVPDIPANVTSAQMARQVLEFFYPDISFPTITADHERLAARMLLDALEGQRMMDMIPRPPGNRPSPTWLVSEAVKIAWRQAQGPQGISTPIRNSVARNWRTTLEEIRNGLPPTGLSLSASAPAMAFQAGAFELVRSLGQQDIPLDPANGGGMSIDWQYLEPADIILVARSGFPSDQIREATGSDASHAMLYIGVQNGQHKVIESASGGVQSNPLSSALSGAQAAAAFRYPGLTGQQRNSITGYAAQMMGEGRGFHYMGLISQARFRYDVGRVCSGLTGSDAQACRAGRARVRLGSEAQSDNFICSQLVAESFKQAGAPLTNDPSHWVAPGDLVAENVNLLVDLEYIGHVLS